jgi:ThiF family
MSILMRNLNGLVVQSGDEAHVSWRPEILDPGCSQDAARLDELCEHGRVWQVHDTLEAQLVDLARTRNPHRALSQEEAESEARALLGGEPIETYGSWVFYAWSGRLVRILAPDEFRELRLDRNRNKITVEEQNQLQQLTVAVVGLSVGNAVAVTLAQEGNCGRLKLTDFDSLEVSNMNRLRARIDEVGLPKTVLAARQIYELNPYANISLSSGGLTVENVGDFLTGDPVPDVVIDECDSIEMKFLIREHARALRIPVFMETSDRGIVDIERFDLEPRRPLFHGLVGALTSADIRIMPREERMQVVLSIVERASLSKRMAASLGEIGRTLSTWPQIASEVTLAGASMTTAVRRIGLGQRLASGRTYVDLDAHLEGLESGGSIGDHLAQGGF